MSDSHNLSFSINDFFTTFGNPIIYETFNINIFKMQVIDNYSFKGKKAIIRVDFNVPLNDAFEVTDDTRIRGALPTINRILNDGGSAILMSHLGRPKSGPEEKFSLKNIIPAISSLLGKPVKFAGDCIGEDAKSLAGSIQAGEVLLLEKFAILFSRE